MAQKLINPTKKVDRKSFADFLAGFPDLGEELADALNDMVHASTETGKLSELTLKNATSQAATTAVAVPDERAAFEAWAKSEDMSIGSDCDGYIHSNTATASLAWQARAALAATPAAATTLTPRAHFIKGWDAARMYLGMQGSVDSDRAMRQYMVAIPASYVEAAAAPVVPTGWVPCVVTHEGQHPEEVAYGPQIMMDRLKKWLERYFELKAAAPVVLPEPVGSMSATTPRTVAWNCAFMPEAGTRLYTEQQLRAALLAGVSAPAALAVERGEVLVTVSGFTGSGKSAIAGEIEIMCRALGLQVEWPDSDSEKHMTHADWIAALEQYKPRVRIVECNVPHSVVKGQDK